MRNYGDVSKRLNLVYRIMHTLDVDQRNDFTE